MKTTEEMIKGLNQMKTLVDAFEKAEGKTEKAKIFKEMFYEMETLVSDMNSLCATVGKPDKKDTAILWNVFVE